MPSRIERTQSAEGHDLVSGGVLLASFGESIRVLGAGVDGCPNAPLPRFGSSLGPPGRSPRSIVSLECRPSPRSNAGRYGPIVWTALADESFLRLISFFSFFPHPPLYHLSPSILITNFGNSDILSLEYQNRAFKSPSRAAKLTQFESESDNERSLEKLQQVFEQGVGRRHRRRRCVLGLFRHVDGVEQV